MRPLLEINHLSIRGDNRPLLDNVCLKIMPATVHAVIGPNGAGKSTLGYAIMGLNGYDRPAGEIVFAGKRINGLDVSARAKAGITLGWQEPVRFEGIPIKRYLELSGASGRHSPETLLERVGLEPVDYLNRAADSKLSGGERKRVEIASVLAMQPKLAIFDEPDSGIDIEALKMVAGAIRSLKRSGSAVLLITHSALILKLADTASLICNGRIINEGPAQEVKTYYKKKCIVCAHQNLPDEKKISKNHE